MTTETASTGGIHGGVARRLPDFFRWVTALAAVSAVFVLGWIFWEVFDEAKPALEEYGLGFLTGAQWQPNRDRYGVLPFLVGTVATAVIALLLAFPPGLAIAIFLSEDFLPRHARDFVRFVVELLAAIPSVVYGLWVLALMVLPTITAISRASLVAVPRTLREGAYALGATRWEAILGVILPTAAPGVVAATILALGRAMGETMAVAMLIGNSSRLSWSLFAPSGTLASLLANQFGEAEGMQVAALMYAALVLVALTLAVNFAGEAVLRYTEKRTAGIR